MRTPPHLLAAGRLPASQGPLFVDGLVTAVDVLTVTVQLPWRPADEEARAWRLQRLGNVVTYRRTMQVCVWTCVVLHTWVCIAARVGGKRGRQSAHDRVQFSI